jgi:hypothetical protein
MNPMALPLLVAFAGGPTGTWRIEGIDVVRGDALPSVERLEVIEGEAVAVPPDAVWVLRGTTSNERYVTRAEQAALGTRQEPLGRTEATSAALIPIRKSAAWWQLAQDERREIFEARSRHVATGLEYLPAVARRLHHARDLGESFDFLTWFEYAPEHRRAFEELVARLRATEEWRYVDREVDVRLSREPR